MKFKEITSVSSDYKEIKEDFKWDIKYWFKNKRIGYFYVKVDIDKDKVRLTLSEPLSVDELNDFQNNFGLILSMKRSILTENISEMDYLCPIGTCKRVIYTFR